MIEITGSPHGKITLIKNRPFEEWHRIPLLGSFYECADGNCPHQNHRSADSFRDPANIQHIWNLQPGTRVLALIEYCSKWHVSYLTLDQVFDPSGEYAQLRFIEPSQECYFFRPGGGFSMGHSFLVNTVRYLATIENKSIEAFGKFGARRCFIRELARIGEINPDIVTAEMQKLDSMSTTPPAKVRPWTLWSKNMLECYALSDYDGLRASLRLLLPSLRIIDCAVFFVAMTCQGRIEEVVKALAPMRKEIDSVLGPLLAVMKRQAEFLANQICPELQGEVDGWEKRWTSALTA